MEIILISTGAVCLLIFLLPILHRVLNSGTAAGAGIGTAYILLGIFWHKLSFTASKYLAFLAIFFIIVMLTLYRRVLIHGRETDESAEVLIVLGCRIRGDVPSLALEKRIESAFFFLMDNPNTVAILSGGQGADENLSEGLCIYEHLVSRGIDKNRLIVEDRSVNTNENISFSLRIIEERGLSKRVAVCTSEYHQLRAGMICRRYGLDPIPCSSKTLPILLPTFVLRELMGIVKEKLFPNIKFK